ncbi:MAG TPA: ATP-dependent DNA helicase RecG [Treponema sp.]|nr:MAG: ATP-dependent DNA helicase RecG [Treponema sp. GWC1_61_84]HCM25321.1 ATP-dependent DNA helicase RecG [Treponema sp.]
MFLRELDASVTHVTGAGPAIERKLASVGVANVAGLLSYYPRDWEDRSRRIPLADFLRNGTVCTEVEVLAHDWFGAGRMKTLKVIVEDGSARAVLVCFNRPFLEKQLPVGSRFRLWGRFYYKYGEIQSTAFEAEPVAPTAAGTPYLAPSGAAEGAAAPAAAGPGAGAAAAAGPAAGRILPVYPLSAGLVQGELRRIIKRALHQYGQHLENELPAALIERDGLMTKAAALAAIHFPSSMKELEEAKRTLIYEELFYLETIVGKQAMARRTARRTDAGAEAAPLEAASRGAAPRGAAPALSPKQALLAERLPFDLTGDQKAAITQMNADMEDGFPMARLLQGDVGSGKTLVAFMACLRAVELGGQAAVMAPTELLARQHAENAAVVLEPLGIRLAFLTGNVKASGRSRLLRALSEGSIDIVVGTHALFSRDVEYRSLRLVVVDEQHRFGVTQRAAIMAKGDLPDLLMMSATPIPRTLALTVFGDLDVTVIRQMPAGRKPIKTHLSRQSNEAKVYDFVRAELDAGRQAYFVYPLIEGEGEGSGAGSGEGSGADGIKDAVSMARRLATKVFPKHAVALVHSKLEEEEKRLAMESFRNGKARVLVATSVVEVGVDVPNASCMVVEHAERFGLSALHQLRGRVGRGDAQSYCFLVYSEHLADDGKARLKAMLESGDGFVIAEEDLKLRGPGQIAGIEQSGYLSLGLADPVRDAKVLERARADAFSMLERDPELALAEHRVVSAVLERAPPFSEVVQ